MSDFENLRLRNRRRSISGRSAFLSIRMNPIIIDAPTPVSTNAYISGSESIPSIVTSTPVM